MEDAPKGNQTSFRKGNVGQTDKGSTFVIANSPLAKSDMRSSVTPVPKNLEREKIHFRKEHQSNGEKNESL